MEAAGIILRLEALAYMGAINAREIVAPTYYPYLNIDDLRLV